MTAESTAGMEVARLYLESYIAHPANCLSFAMVTADPVVRTSTAEGGKVAAAPLPLPDTMAECHKAPTGKRRVTLACDGRSGYVGLPPADKTRPPEDAGSRAGDKQIGRASCRERV